MMRGWDYGYNMMGGGWAGTLIMLFFGLLILAGIVLVIVWAIRASSGHGQVGQGHPGAGSSMSSGAAAHDEAVAIAKRRFASGEIDKTQYDEIMRGLSG